MRFSALVVAGVATCGLVAALTPVRAGDAMVTKPVGKYFLFEGVNTRIDGIQTVAKADGNPVLNVHNGASDQQDPNKGYILLHFTQQNPSSSEDRYAGTVSCTYSVSFELQDGSQTEMWPPPAILAGKSLSAMPPDQLHPKQTVAVTYVIYNWPGSPITKMFMKGGTNCPSAFDPKLGPSYVEFQIPPKFVTTLEPMPVPSPT